ncbi:MAG: FAD:protein FMN transferase [Myxococcales bacterium]|nr:FAD:protein FMN transferase [Myxococcales bacterium]
MAPPPPDGTSPLGPLTVKHLSRRFLPPLLFVGALFAFQYHRGQQIEAAGGGRGELALQGETMGTTWSVKVVGEGLDEAGLRATIQGELDAVVAAMSTYEPTSELSKLNARAETTPTTISPALRTVLALALQISAASDGAFDVTVGPLVNAWGFGPQKRGTPPDAATHASLRERVGWQKLALDAAAGTLAKAHPQTYVDLSAIAKGYGVDRVALALEAKGHDRYLVEVGGELRVRGHNAHGAPWRLGVEAPLEDRRAVQAVVPLTAGAMATSGDYRNFYEQDGQRISHTIDPRKGAPITHRLASVSVVAADCATADGWATALNVLGPDEGFAKAQALGLAAYFLVRRPDGDFEAKVTPAFERLLPNR